MPNDFQYDVFLSQRHWKWIGNVLGDVLMGRRLRNHWRTIRNGLLKPDGDRAWLASADWGFAGQKCGN